MKSISVFLHLTFPSSSLHRRELFQRRNGAREHALKILVVITDGRKYQDPLAYEDVIPEADREGVIRYVIGVGDVALQADASVQGVCLDTPSLQLANTHKIKVGPLLAHMYVYQSTIVTVMLCNKPTQNSVREWVSWAPSCPVSSGRLGGSSAGLGQALSISEGCQLCLSAGLEWPEPQGNLALLFGSHPPVGQPGHKLW